MAQAYPLHAFAHTKHPTPKQLGDFDAILEVYAAEINKEDGDVPRDVPRDARCRHPFPHEATHQGAHLLVNRWLKRFPHLVHTPSYTDAYGLTVIERIVVDAYSKEDVLKEHYPEYEELWRPYAEQKVTMVEQITQPHSMFSFAPFVGHVVPYRYL